MRESERVRATDAVLKKSKKKAPQQRRLVRSIRVKQTAYLLSKQTLRLQT